MPRGFRRKTRQERIERKALRPDEGYASTTASEGWTTADDGEEEESMVVPSGSPATDATATTGKALPPPIFPTVQQRKLKREACYAYLEGCPAHLGCTLVLRGGSETLLKEVSTALAEKFKKDVTIFDIDHLFMSSRSSASST